MTDDSHAPVADAVDPRDARIAELEQYNARLRALLADSFPHLTPPDSPPAPQWVPLKAATAPELPYPTLQKWAASGRVASIKRGGRVLVDALEIGGLLKLTRRRAS